MAKKRQISINLDEDVHRWFRSFGLKNRQSNTRIGLIGLILIQTADEQQCAEAVDLASWLDKGLIRWRLFESMATLRRAERILLVEVIRDLLVQGISICEHDEAEQVLQIATEYLGATKVGKAARAVAKVREAAGTKQPSTRRHHGGA